MTATRPANTDTKAHGYLTQIDGVDHYRIDEVQQMEPFLMSVVSSSDLWMFASSTSTLTAGRIDADHAFLPYETVDRLHRAVSVTGPTTIIARTVAGRRELWRPFGREADGPIRRSVAKSVLGNRLVYEEVHDEWGLSFRATWKPSPSFGWVRQVELHDTGGSGAQLEVLDGLLDVMPGGVDARTEQLLSNLVDSYKRTEAGPWGTAALYTLESLITDRAEPAESLTATVVWSEPGPLGGPHLDESVIGAMVSGRNHAASDLVTGRRGSYLLRGDLDLEPGATAGWTIVADAGLDHAGLTDRIAHLTGSGSHDRIAADIEAGTERLRQLLGGADAFQQTGDPIADAHHLSNVLFNSMRGGLFPYGHQVPMTDFADHLRRWNQTVHGRHRNEIATWEDWIGIETLRGHAVATDDPHLIRLSLEYLPLAFSRRHGDPSRPWNRFAIRVRGPSGEVILGYEGNWRDIFQNWEALMMSHPGFLPNAVAKFVNASTVDGHNPYRITNEGIDWETPDPHDPWSNIGYWGDHQIVYLHRLVELWERLDPDGMTSWLHRPVFVYADVPYTIANYDDMRRDPRETIAYDTEKADRIAEQVSRLGNDGRLLVDADGDIVQVGLFEKLLVPVLAKLTSFVPGGGIWMNTQRPEWNDANNALAGYGLSMVTLYHLSGYVSWLTAMVKSDLTTSMDVSASVEGWLSALTATLERFGESCHDDDLQRRAMMDELGAVGDQFQRADSADFDRTPVSVPVSDIARLLDAAREHLEFAIEGGRRSDGLFDSYNLVSFPSDGAAHVDRLGPMLEGQVAVLSSGTLDASQSLAVIDALYASGLYQADQNSFMLYPARELPGFVERNTFSAEQVGSTDLIDQLLGSTGILMRDHRELLHFSPDIVNEEALAAALEDTGLSADQCEAVHDLYEHIFNHHAYTGRSGSMYGYEGIGSIYWHMVGKLLVAVQETHRRAVDHNAPVEAITGLTNAYRRIRAGLGFCKSPGEYGAIPTDCYSHTPASGGAKQPGMTGHVKELMLTRFGELGLRAAGGVLSLSPGLLELSQLIDADAGLAEFHYCGIPFFVERGDHDAVATRRAGAWTDQTAGLSISFDDSTAILGRTKTIEAVKFTLGPDHD